MRILPIATPAGFLRSPLTALLLLLLAAIAQAQTTVMADRPFTQLIGAWTRTLDRLAAEVARPDLVPAEIDFVRGELQNVREAALAAAALARDDLQAVRTMVAPLEPVPGPPGPDGKPGPPPPESDAVRLQREQLQLQAAEVDGRVKQAEAVVARVDQLLQRLAKQREALLLQALLARSPSPLAPSTWAGAAADGRASWQLLADAWRDWRRQGLLASAERAAPWALGGAVLLIAVYLGLRRMRHHLGRRATPAVPTYRERVLAVAVDGLAMAALPISAVAWLCFTLVLCEPPKIIAELIVDIGKALGFALLVYGVTETGLAPTRPQWRLMPFADSSAARLSSRLQLLAWTLAGLHVVAAILVPDRSAGLDLISIVTALGSLLTLLVGLPLLRSDAWLRAAATGETAATTGAIGGGKWALGRFVLMLLPPIAVAAAFTGYSNLAQALLYSSVQSLLVIVLALVLHALARDLLEAAAAADTPTGSWLRRAMGLAADAEMHWRHIVLLLIDILILIGLCIAVPMIWGVEPQTLRGWAGQLLTGLKIGGRTISLVDVGLALLVFAIVVLLTRGLRRGLRDRVLPTLAVPEPVRFTIDAGINYVGLTIALVLAVVALGVDFSSLALILGALSVGIGLGLQNIANNVVSGVVLLLERPIRVGDRISISGHEGIVRRINVRATEIETAERALVLVPNSQLLQNIVVNASFADYVGRIEFVVMVAVGSDLARVEQTMKAAAEAHEQVARFPAPQILLHKIVDGAVEVELRVWLRDRTTGVRTRNELADRVLAALSQAGIALPTRRVDPATPALHASPEGGSRPA